jgi:hypothetical protein
MIYGHIASYEHHKGPIPSGMVVRHTCDNPICVNPDHLVLGTTSDNRRDVTERKRGGEYGRKLSETDVREIRRLQEAGSTLSEITERFGISTAQASKICSRKAWKWLN